MHWFHSFPSYYFLHFETSHQAANRVLHLSSSQGCADSIELSSHFFTVSDVFSYVGTTVAFLHLTWNY